MPTIGRRGGFTLVEILVVVVIAGILTGTVLLGMVRSGPGQAHQRELSRLSASLEVLCDQALLSGTAGGLRFHAEGYDFWMHTPNGWQQLPAEGRPSAVRWPEGLRPRVQVENLALGPVRNARAPQVICTGIEPPTGFVIELGTGDNRRNMSWPR
ncbi:MAG: prepilin-type N-terminal cleavage/methylation domain-containing protein [Wenzhouxiangellaceae bacterium]